MSTRVRQMIEASISAEEALKGEISELLLLLKSGKLSDKEKEALKKRLDLEIDRLEIMKRNHGCCKK